MKAPLHVVTEGLVALRRQLTIAQSVLDIAETDLTACTPPTQLARIVALQERVREHPTEFRLHQYRSIVIALYGLLERFIESLVEMGVTRWAGLATNYADLPESLRNHHLRLTLEVLQHRGDQKYHEALQVEDFIARLHGCQSGVHDFSVNSIVFAHHTANFRHEVVKQVLGCACFDLSSVDSSPGVTGVMSERFPDMERYGVIDDLAQRRNEVSHGDDGPTLSLAFLGDYMAVVEAYCIAITSAVVETLAAFSMVHLGVLLGVPDVVFNNTIAGFESARVDLVVGDVLGYRRGDGRCAVSTIKSLQVDGDDRDHTVSGENIGLTTQLRCNDNTQIFYLPANLADLSGGGLEVLT